MTRRAGRAARAAGAQPPSPPGSRRRRSAPTAAARSASPPPAAGSSASSPSATGCRSAPTTATGSGSATSARSRAPCTTPRCSPTSSARPGSPGAARTDPPPLRIAVSFKPALPCKLHPEMRAATERTVALLDELGHTTVERDPDYGDIRPLFVPRYARGAYLDSERLGGPHGLEPRARSIVRIGKRLGKRADRAVAQEAERAARINRIFDDVDVVLTSRDRGAGAAARPGRPPQRRPLDPQQHAMGRLHAAVEPHRPARDGDPRRASTAPAYQPVCSSSRGPARSRRSSRWQPKWSEWPRSSIG